MLLLERDELALDARGGPMRERSGDARLVVEPSGAESLESLLPLVPSLSANAEPVAELRHRLFAAKQRRDELVPL